MRRKTKRSRKAKKPVRRKPKTVKRRTRGKPRKKRPPQKSRPSCHGDTSRLVSGGDKAVESRVLVIGDTHCSGMRSGYVSFLQSIAEMHNINRVVHIGVLVDWTSISFHDKAPSLRNSTQEYKLAKKQGALLARAFPKADWLIGNHDCLTQRQADMVGLPSDVLRDYNDLWQIDWKVHPRFASLVIDGVIYKHGDSGRGGQDAAFNQAKDNFRSTVLGHFHSSAGVKWWANPEFRVFGMAVGCGIDASKLQFEYGRKITKKPILGCGVVINGKRAVFEPWLLKSR